MVVMMALKLARMAVWVAIATAMVGEAWGLESVTINNKLPGNLNVFCHSYEDDLPIQNLAPFTGQYIFHFHANLLGDTLFTCNFNAPTKSTTATMDVWEGFNYSHPRCNCTQCTWDVSPAGFSCNGNFVAPWN